MLGPFKGNREHLKDIDIKTKWPLMKEASLATALMGELFCFLGHHVCLKLLPLTTATT